MSFNYSDKYISNCILECVRQKIIAPRDIKIHKYGSWIKCLKNGHFPHFYCYNNRTKLYIDFRKKRKSIDSKLTFFNSLFYSGNLYCSSKFMVFYK